VVRCEPSGSEYLPGLSAGDFGKTRKDQKTLARLRISKNAPTLVTVSGDVVVLQLWCGVIEMMHRVLMKG
jgi:hypothetical protein